LHAVTAIDLEITGVILPDNAELNHPLWDRSDFERSAVFGLFREERTVLECEGQLCEATSVSVSSKDVDAIDLPLYACSNSGSEGRCDMVTSDELGIKI
jgi:hypothetical protein